MKRLDITIGAGVKPGQPVDVDAAFADFVKTIGGEIVCDLLPKDYKRPNADFLFRDAGIVAELKRLAENKADDEEFVQKRNNLVRDWIDRRLIGPIYGKARMESLSLPQTCQRELFEFYKPSLQVPIKKANKQIKATADEFEIPDAKGLLFIVNDDNLALEPEIALYLIGRVLGKDFRMINSIIYCTVNRIVRVPAIERPTLLWVHATRPMVPSIDQSFIDKIYSKWCTYLGQRRGHPIRRLEIGPGTVAAARYDAGA